MYARYVLPALMVLASQAIAAGQPAGGPSPKGDWLVADGTAVIHIDACAAAPPGKPDPSTLCGLIAWTKYPPGVDENNPDPEKRTRPIIGLPILIAMKPSSDGKWEGEVYNAENGKTYQSYIKLKSADTLTIQGCVFGFLCGGEDWTRTKLETSTTTPPATQTPAHTPPTSGTPGQKKAEPAPRTK